MAAPSESLAVLVLSAGMSYADLALTLDKLKESSKSCGTHKARQVLWAAYTKLSNKISGSEGPAFCFLKYSCAAEAPEDGSAEMVELSKRQRGLVSGGCDLMGHKVKPPEEGKGWCMLWSDDEAQAALDDLMESEPCIYVAAEGVYVGTRFKRALCKALSAPLKAAKDVEKLVAELAPEKPLKSISFTANAPPAVTEYNVLVAGPPVDGLPASIGHVPSASPQDVYAAFVERRNGHELLCASRLIGAMLADQGKKLGVLVSAGNQQEAAIAYKNGLMKKVYVHERFTKFVDRLAADGQVELHVIRGDVEKTEFGQYGGLVFELYYRDALAPFT
jgi:hypothetical protein